MGIEGDTIGIAPVGCAVMAYDYFKCDMIEAAHGRAPATATGVKRALPDKFVFTYQGDGDCAAIGTAETVHAATRGENIVVIFVNNAIYGMTGGQMAPTSLPGQVTQTTPYGRDVSVAGNPIKMVEMLSVLDGVALAQRVAVNTVPHIREAKKAIRKAFENEKATSEVVLEEIEFKDITKTYNGGVTTIKADVYNNTNVIKDINVEIILKDANGNKVKSMIQAIEAIEPGRKKILQTGITGDYTNVKNVEFNVLSDAQIQQYN